MQRSQMKIILLLFTLLLSTYLQAQNTLDPYKNVKYFKLTNGLQVYMLANKEAVNTEISVDVKVGFSIEDESNSGISHLVEHLVFRDQRVPHHDYLDYIKDEGATDINGYTSENNTRYIATIDSNKTEFIVEIFAQMIFDKNVNEEDLKIEKRALQTEIGELEWYDKFFGPPLEFLKPIFSWFPDRLDVFEHSFGLEKDREPIASYIEKRNNYKFTLDEVMQHYKEYYYPANMTLKVVGNFDEEKIITLIKQKYGTISIKGTKQTTELPYNASLDDKEFKTITMSQNNKNIAYVGSRYLFDDYKKYLILKSYAEYLSRKMQRLLRNKLGKTYSVSVYRASKRDARIIGVSFDSLHEEFEENLKVVQREIDKDVIHIDKKEIQKALDQSRLYYSSMENDSGTLMLLLHITEYVRIHLNLYDKTPYEIFNSISVESFQDVVSKQFVQKNSYLYIFQDYYIFPYDNLLFFTLMLILIIYIGMKISKMQMYRQGVYYSQREVLFSRRLTSKFLSFITFTSILLLASFISDWSEYYIFSLLFGSPYYPYTLETPYNIIYLVFSFVLFFSIYIGLLITVFKNIYTRIDITKERLNIVGNSLVVIKKEEIQEIRVVSYSINKYLKIKGNILLFWKPLVMLKDKQGELFYMRSSNAQELAEDLLKWQMEK